MSVKNDYKFTLGASYVGYITQAVVNNFSPLLFITFCTDYGVSIAQLAFLSSFNFLVQLVIDLLAAKFVDRIGYRKCTVFAHFSASAGLLMLGFLPDMLPVPFAGIIISTVFCAVGGGLIEVLVSPVVESCPTKNKSAHMSLLHSFYCWGQLFTVLASTVFFAVFGIRRWSIMSAVWALIPFLNGILFSLVPMYYPEKAEDGKNPVSLKNRLFVAFIFMMLCAGACELAVSQWASSFVESALHLPKAYGDIAGPCMFALLMGLSRVFHSKFGSKLDGIKYMFFCAALCLCGYLLASLSGNTYVSLAGMAVCGFAVGVMWPGTYSIASEKMPKGGTAMFALLALAGDAGAASGPGLVGWISSLFGDDLKKGLLAACIFPVILMITAGSLMRKNTKKA